MPVGGGEVGGALCMRDQSIIRKITYEIVVTYKKCNRISGASLCYISLP